MTLYVSWSLRLLGSRPCLRGVSQCIFKTLHGSLYPYSTSPIHILNHCYTVVNTHMIIYLALNWDIHRHTLMVDFPNLSVLYHYINPIDGWVFPHRGISQAPKRSASSSRSTTPKARSALRGVRRPSVRLGMYLMKWPNTGEEYTATTGFTSV